MQPYVKRGTRVCLYPGSPFRGFAAPSDVGTLPAIPLGMQQLILTADQAALVDEVSAAQAPALNGDEMPLTMPLTEAKRLAAAEFERRYLVRVMERANGSVSEGARLSGLDRTNFRRLLQRHGLR